jgi:hypothetical protein
MFLRHILGRALPGEHYRRTETSGENHIEEGQSSGTAMLAAMARADHLLRAAKKTRYNIGTPLGGRTVGLHSESVGKRLTLLRQKL